jgi:hypothetical protein
MGRKWKRDKQQCASPSRAQPSPPPPRLLRCIRLTQLLDLSLGGPGPILGGVEPILLTKSQEYPAAEDLAFMI